jgi:hypothetical protein
LQLQAAEAEDKSFKSFKFKGKLPSSRSIALFLKAEGLIRPYERHSKLPQSDRPKAEVKAPHEEWEMDAKGQQFVDKVGVITLINLNDCYSRVRLLSYPCFLGKMRVERHPTTEDYQLVLRLAFSEWGLPDRIATDHDTVFYDNGSKSPFPSRLHLWLLALGVELVFGRHNCPTDQGLTERSHQLWEKQVLLGQEFDSWNALYSALLKRRDFLNHHLPCASIGELPPLVAYPQAQKMRRGKLYRPEWEVELLDISRIYAYLAKGRWFRLASNIGSVSLGGQVYVLGRTWAKEQVEITFDASEPQPQQHSDFVFRSADGKRVKCIPVKGITVDTLIGEMSSLIGLPEFQLNLPFTWNEWQMIRLYDTFRCTT